MKKLLLYALVISFFSLGFYACSEDDDDPVTPQNTMPTSGGGNGGGSGGGPGSGSGNGTGGGTGSGGIPPNSMKVTIDGNVIEFDSVSGDLMGSNIEIIGSSNSPYPRLKISIADTIAVDSFFFPDPSREIEIYYYTNSNTVYDGTSGYAYLRTLDTSSNLVNGRFEVVMKNLNDVSDSLVFTKGQFNKFYK